jgi:MFS transporter, ACS family, DAL5 transporter family protein
MGGNAKAAFAIGVMIGLGNCGNLVSSNVFITDESPQFKTGFGTGLGLNMLGVVASSTLELYCLMANRRRDAGKDDAKLDNSSDVLGDLGDDHPEFRYILLVSRIP